MKFSVSSSDLLKQLQMVSGAIGNRPVLPILEDFLFVLEKNRLTISATDLESSVTTGLEVDGKTDGSIAIPARILLDTLKGLPEQPIHFDIDLKSFGIIITSSYGEYQLAGENGADFPRIPQAVKVDTINLPAEILERAITRTLFATSNDDLRPAMTGVFFEIEKDKIRFVSTNAHKLVRYTFKNISSAVNASFIIPKKTLNLLKTPLALAQEVVLSFDKTNAFFAFGDVHLVCRLIDARYPDYNAVIPKDQPYAVTISRDDFLSSLKRIAIYANKTTNQVSLNIDNGSLTISSQDIDFSNAAKEQLACTYTGEAMKIGFNAKFLIEMLSVIKSSEVILELNSPSKPGVLLPTETEDDEDILMLCGSVSLA